MLKKIMIIPIFAFIVTSSVFAADEDHIASAVNSVKRIYQKCVVGLKKIEELSPELYAKNEPIVMKVINSQEFVEKMNEAIEQQYNEIVDQGESLSRINQETSLVDFFPTMSSPDKYLVNLYKFLADKAYSQLLWQKLTAQEQQESSEEFEVTDTGLIIDDQEE